MTSRSKPKATVTPPLPIPDASTTGAETPDEALAILWGIARNPEESGTARVAACRLLLMDARERGNDGEARHAADLNKRALALMRRAAN
jgi:hypothetical protein